MVDANKLIEYVKFVIDDNNDLLTSSVVRKVVLEMIRKVGIMDAVPVKHGYWVKADLDETYVTCSNCKSVGDKDRMAFNPGYAKDILKYCPNCGAKMDGERREE